MLFQSGILAQTCLRHAVPFSLTFTRLGNAGLLSEGPPRDPNPASLAGFSLRWIGFLSFSTVFHRRIPHSCDEQPLPRIQKAHSGTVPRVSSTQPTENTSTRDLLASPNSLIQKILPISPFALRFCSGQPISTSRNSKKTSILSGRYQKKVRGLYPEFQPRRLFVCTSHEPCFPSTPMMMEPSRSLSRTSSSITDPSGKRDSMSRRSLVRVVVSLLSMLFVCPSCAQTVPPLDKIQNQQELDSAITTLDEALFDAYNKCDLDKFAPYIDENVEFYHNQGGVTLGRAALTDSVKKNICGKVTRELVPGSLHVYHMKGYGARATGHHEYDASSCKFKPTFTHWAAVLSPFPPRDGSRPTTFLTTISRDAPAPDPSVPQRRR